MFKLGFLAFLIGVFFLFQVISAREENCTKPIYTGPCRANFPRYGYNSKTDECVQFTYGGCGDNGNNFKTKQECEDACIDEDKCSKPIYAGLCFGYFPRYGYNSEKGECVQFIYGGCGDNGNNFKTKQECEDACFEEDKCSKPIYTGLCRGSFPRYGYNSEKGECVQFIYGGCGDNGNNFETKQECEDACINCN